METASEMAHAKLHLLMMSLPLSSVKRVVVRPLGWEWGTWSMWASGTSPPVGRRLFEG